MAAPCEGLRGKCNSTEQDLHDTAVWDLWKILEVAINANNMIVHLDSRWDDSMHSLWRLVPWKGKETIDSRTAICTGTSWCWLGFMIILTWEICYSSQKRLLHEFQGICFQLMQRSIESLILHCCPLQLKNTGKSPTFLKATTAE